MVGHVYQSSSTCYSYYENENKKDEYCISVQNYLFIDENDIPDIISNYFIDDPVLNTVIYFASITWNKIDYKNDDYNPYNYDPDPKCIIYRDDLDINVINKYLHIIDILSNKFYEPTTHYKHFNPLLEKIPLSKIELSHNYKIINEIIDSF
jgi:hypothetical protein